MKNKECYAVKHILKEYAIRLRFGSFALFEIESICFDRDGMCEFSQSVVFECSSKQAAKAFVDSLNDWNVHPLHLSEVAEDFGLNVFTANVDFSFLNDCVLSLKTK